MGTDNPTNPQEQVNKQSVFCLEVGNPPKLKNRGESGEGDVSKGK